MTNPLSHRDPLSDYDPSRISDLNQLAEFADYSLMQQLVRDPNATDDGNDHAPRQVFSGHYVPVTPTPIGNPEYIAHSHTLFETLNFDDRLATDPDFVRLFSGDMSNLPEKLSPYGWATGYALSIYGTEYIQQCPFRTGNGYGDGRAMSVLEVVIDDMRWEMQLKGGGRTPYCRGADGRAVLRSSVREFLAQEFMHALGIPTSRSLTLYVSKSDQVDRPWYFEGSRSEDPEIMVSNPVAISTRVAPSFLRVGQLELFGRRARHREHPNALKELEDIVLHLIAREYQSEIAEELPLEDKVLALATHFRDRLTGLVAEWIRVGFCQGNFNSDNCAAGGFTLDYGPFGFCEMFEPGFQPWTGGGRHFSFLNQPMAAEKNFGMFCLALEPLLQNSPETLDQLKQIQAQFSEVMEGKLAVMWSAKLGMSYYDRDLLMRLLQLCVNTSVDYTMLFRILSDLPNHTADLETAFYKTASPEIQAQWQDWLDDWQQAISDTSDQDKIRTQMKQVNPKYTWREWLIAPAYQAAAQGDYSLVLELQQMLLNPYQDQSAETDAKYNQLRPEQYFWSGGISHYSCSS